MKHIAIILWLAIQCVATTAQAVTDTFSTAGSSTWTAPAGVTSITVEAWGGGGAGGGATGNPAKGGGGAGGQYASKVVAVTPGSNYSVVVGGGGTGSTGNGTAGGDSSFDGTSVVAKGGAGGTENGAAGAGSATGGVGTTVYAGGSGSNGFNGGTTTTGGAGGGGAGSTGTGGSASGNTAGTGTATGGGGGGAGRTAGGTGNSGNAAGGGGGGGYATSNTDRSGGNGANGRVDIGYVLPPAVTTNAASALSITGATLNGTVSSNGATTTVTFEYGLTTSYGSTLTAAQSPLAAGASSSPVSAAVTGLICNTLYHFRAKGVNSAGTTNGSDLTFTTSACPVVSSINRASTNPTTANTSVSWTVTFSLSVTGVDDTDFSLVQSGGATGASITSVTGSGTTWTVTANTGTSDAGTLGLNLVDNDSISSAPTALLGGAGANNGNFTGEVYTLSPPIPTLSKTASTSAAVNGDIITFAIKATNTNSVGLTNVVLTDVLPTGMSYATHAATLGTVVVAGQTITWTIPSLPASTSAQLTLAVSLSQQGSLTNTVTAPGAAPASASVLVLASAVTHFRLDEPAGSWTGATGEVIDSGSTALHGRRLTTSTPTTTNAIDPSPTIASQYASVVGGFCNAGQFDGKGVVEVADSPLFDYTTKLSASAWIYPTAYPSSDLYSILSNDVNYEFHLNPSGKLFWWWNSATLTSAATIPLNRWTHIAITFDSSATGGRQKIYINGVADTNTNNWKGTLAANNCNFYIGGDITTGAACSLIPGRNFRGMIDEVKLYSFELSAAEVQADMTLGRSCSGAFDHIRIEHDGAGSVCNPETVTVKACLDSACSTLYPGAVTVRLSPTGWVGGDTFTFTGGVTTRQLSNGTAGVITLGTGSASPVPANAARCFIGATESCSMTFAAASCAFDAIETGALPKTRIYTKLANTGFNLDVVALSSGSTINTTYTGTVAVDLVDTSSSGCPTGTGLNTAQNITFVAGDLGRKNVSFSSTYLAANAAKNARVRMRVGSTTPACSTDNFAIRPSAITLVTIPTMAIPPSATATPTIKAGANFTLRATTSPAAAYAGSLALDTAKLTAQTTTQDTTKQNGGTVGALAPASLLVNDATLTNNANYSEVGYLYLAPGAFRDDDFTAVDKNQPTGCNAASTCDCISDTTNDNHLSDALVGSTGRYGCAIGNKTNVSFGRFIPDHFDTVVDPLAVVGMPCPTGLACPTLFNGFVYSAQPFPVWVSAQKLGGGTTTNYAGKFAKNINLAAWDGKGSTTAQNPGPGSLIHNTIRAARFSAGTADDKLAGTVGVSNGSATVTGAGTLFLTQLGVGDAINIAGVDYIVSGIASDTSLSLSAPYAAASAPVVVAYVRPAYGFTTTPTAPTDIYIRADEATGGDGVTSLRSPSANSVEGGIKIVSGRIRVANAYGSELLKLPIGLAVQYWNGSRWVSSTTDSVTSFNTNKTTAAPVPGNVAVSIAKGPLTVVDVNVLSPGLTTFLNGATTITLDKPGASHNGSADLSITAPSYLPSTPGRATFGIYKSKFIYLREMY